MEIKLRAMWEFSFNHSLLPTGHDEFAQRFFYLLKNLFTPPLKRGENHDIAVF
jgi:hypothetical protein